VWDIDRPTKSEEHPTMKPLELVGRAMDNSSNRGDNVLDLFGGSGTTLMAAEQLWRVCFMMELDPKYCDVIIRRYVRMVEKDTEVYRLEPGGGRTPWAELVNDDGGDGDAE
jgi:16S rRNA G966 N2-methylase RsmD